MDSLPFRLIFTAVILSVSCQLSGAGVVVDTPGSSGGSNSSLVETIGSGKQSTVGAEAKNTTDRPSLTTPSDRRYQMAFGVARSSTTSKVGLLSLPEDVANVNGWYRHETDLARARADGLYFLYLCVGVMPRSTAYVLQTGGYPSQMGYTWQSKSQSDVRLGCRGGISRMTRGVTITLNNRGGDIYSSELQETSFSVFSITDAMTSDDSTLFVSYSSNAPYNSPGPIPFGQSIIYVSPSPPSAQYNAAMYTYTCLTGGYYLVSFSVGVISGQYALVQLADTYSTFAFRLTLTSQIANGFTTRSRSVFFECPENTDLQVQLVDGEITSGTSSADNAISWSVIRYTPVDQAAAAWAFYIDHNWSADRQSDLLEFNIIHAFLNVTYNNGTTTILQSGTYMVYLSAATQPGKPLNLVVKRNGDEVIGLKISNTATDGVEMAEHGVIMELGAGDNLQVVGSNGCSVYSDDGQQVGFWGFLIYSS